MLGGVFAAFLPRAEDRVSRTLWEMALGYEIKSCLLSRSALGTAGEEPPSRFLKFLARRRFRVTRGSVRRPCGV
jgi:hypothetical protein